MSIPVYFGTLGSSSLGAAIWTFAGLPSGIEPNAPVALPAFLWTWDKTPAGPSGVVVFRGVTVTFLSQSGYSLVIQPIVDGIPTAQPSLFNAPLGGEQKCEAQMDARGSRLSAQLTFTNPPAALEFRDVNYAFVPIRGFPKG